MFTKKTTLGAAILAALALGATQEASANVYAGSSLDIQNLTTIVQASGLSFTIEATNTATLNGASGIGEDGCGGTPGSNDCGDTGSVVDANVVNAPGSTITRSENDFSLLGPGLTHTYSNSDSLISTAQLADPEETSTTTFQIAESQVQTDGSGKANTEIISGSSFLLFFTIDPENINGELYLSFEADPYLHVFIEDPLFLNGNAVANIDTSFTLTNEDLDNASISWSPSGTSDINECNVVNLAATCVETNDTQDLNGNLSTGISPSNLFYSEAEGFTDFGIFISGLTPGNYSLAYNSITSTTIRLTQDNVPEPDMLALLGLGILGIGVARRKKAC